MTIFHYGGSWVYIDEPITTERDNSFELTSKEWELVQELDIPSFKVALLTKKKTKGKISK